MNEDPLNLGVNIVREPVDALETTTHCDKIVTAAHLDSESHPGHPTRTPIMMRAMRRRRSLGSARADDEDVWARRLRFTVRSGGSVG